MKSNVDKLDVDKLVSVPTGLSSKLSNLVKSEYKKYVYDVKDKIYDITNAGTKTALNAKINEVKEKTPSISILSTTATANTTINEVKVKISNITNFATITTLTAVENKIPNINELVKKN